jgi:hypothetical protein
VCWCLFPCLGTSLRKSLLHIYIFVLRYVSEVETCFLFVFNSMLCFLFCYFSI